MEFTWVSLEQQLLSGNGNEIAIVGRDYFVADHKISAYWMLPPPPWRKGHLTLSWEDLLPSESVSLMLSGLFVNLRFLHTHERVSVGLIGTPPDP